MSDTVGHDGPSGTGNGGPAVITVNGRRMWVDANTTVVVLLESLGYPVRGIAVALNRQFCPDLVGRRGFPTGRGSKCSLPCRLAES
jgi:hypothetical protein